MRKAIIENGTVTNIIVADEQFTIPGAMMVPVADNDPVFAGCLYRDGVFVPPPPAPPVVPQTVSMRQARLALLGAGLLAKVDQLVANLPDPPREAAIQEWEYSSEVRRDSTFIASLAPALGLTEAQIDQLFINAAQILP